MHCNWEEGEIAFKRMITPKKSNNLDFVIVTLRNKKKKPYYANFIIVMANNYPAT